MPAGNLKSPTHRTESSRFTLPDRTPNRRSGFHAQLAHGSFSMAPASPANLAGCRLDARRDEGHQAHQRGLCYLAHGKAPRAFLRKGALDFPAAIANSRRPFPKKFGKFLVDQSSFRAGALQKAVGVISNRDPVYPPRLLGSSPAGIERAVMSLALTNSLPGFAPNRRRQAAP